MNSPVATGVAAPPVERLNKGLMSVPSKIARKYLGGELTNSPVVEWLNKGLIDNSRLWLALSRRS